MSKLSTIDGILKRHFLYLGLMPFLFFIEGLLSYPFSIPLSDLAICVLTLIGGTYTLFIVSLYLLKDRYKAAYFTFLLLIVLLFSIDLYFVLFSALLRIRYYLAGALIGIGLLFWVFKKNPSIFNNRNINKALNVFSVAYFCIYLVSNIATIRTYSAAVLARASVGEVSANRYDSRELPDIYVLLADGYANSNNLKKYWNFSNDPFLDSLRSQGFHLVDSSRSNYTATIQTVLSMLNMEYYQKEYDGKVSPLMLELVTNKSLKILNQNNYTIKNLSVFDFDQYKSVYHLPDFFPEKSSLAYHCLKRSIWYFYQLGRAETNFVALTQRADNLAQQLINVSKEKEDRPKFVYGHFFLTHPPFYLDASGRFNEQVREITKMTPAESNRFANKDTTDNSFGSTKRDSVMMRSYLNHIRKTNMYLTSVVRDIIANSSRPPIILIMSDHGFRYRTGVTNRETIDEGYGNLCAFYFPDKDYHLISPDITPVNYMRLLFSKALGRPYHPLPNRSGL